MARGTIKIRYKIRVTRRVRVETRVRYSLRTMTTVRYLVEQARSQSAPVSHGQLLETARAMLPTETDEDEIRDAIDTVCEEVDEDA